MNAGRLAAAVLVASGLAAGVALWWLQVHAFYRVLPADAPEAALTVVQADGSAAPLPVRAFAGIDSDSSPIRFRACFYTDPAAPALAAAAPFDGAVPLVAPGWFDCFDAPFIGAALDRGEARAFLARAEVRPGVDLVLAVFPDGRGFAWRQLRPGVAEGRG